MVVYSEHLKSGTPAHVKASLAYNDLLSHYKSNHLEPIRNAVRSNGFT